VLSDGLSVDLRAWHGFCLEHCNMSAAAAQMQRLLPKLRLASLMLNTLYVNRDSRETLTRSQLQHSEYMSKNNKRFPTGRVASTSTCCAWTTVSNPLIQVIALSGCSGTWQNTSRLHSLCLAAAEALSVS